MISMLFILMVLGVFLCALVVLVGGVVATIYFLSKRAKTKPQPDPPAQASPQRVQPVPVVAKTEVMARKCPQCGATLQPDAPEGLCPACLLQRGFATEAGAPAGQPAFVPPPISELAQLFPQLEIQECLGRGGMGAVYKARQPRLDRLVALKILAPEKQSDPQFAERFEREARALARLNHPNIVTVFDFGEVQGRFYLLMEFVDGLTLRQVMQAGKISPAEALNLVPKICEALQYAHEHGIIHRDIKPENILLDKQGRVKIADFGIAKIAGVEAKGLSLTGARDVMGTPNYMAPEQVEKPQTVDHRADIYSLGVVFYEMLTGELPLGKFAPPSQKVQMDVRLDEVVLHALEKEPARRYQQASQVKTAVETIAGSPQPFAPAAIVAAGTPMANTSIITAPAVALMVAGVWKIFGGILGVLALAGINGWLGSFAGLGDLMGGWSSVAIFSVVLFKIIPGFFILFGGYQMLQKRSHAWAIGAGILAIVACSLIGLPAGIWALVVLARDDVKSAFGMSAAAAPTATKPSLFWRFFSFIACGFVLVAITGIVVLAISFMRQDWPKLISGLPPGARAKQLTAQELQQSGLRLQDGEYWTNFSRTFPLDADGRFSIDNVNGRIEIHGWNSNAVLVTTAIHGHSPENINAIKVNIDSDPGYVAVHTVIPSNNQNFSSFSSFWEWLMNHMQDNTTVDYTVQVPAHGRLANVSSVNGHIEIDGVAGDITASTVNGHTQIKGAAHDLKLSTVNGHVSAEMNSLGKGQSVSLNAVNGELDLTVPEDADAKFSVNTINGGITSEFSSLQPKKELVGNHLKDSLGNGDATVKADTVNGTVKILKRQTIAPLPSPVSSLAKSPEATVSTATSPASNVVPTLETTTTQVGSNVQGAQAAVSGAQKWLGAIDAGGYSESWKEASAIFQAGVTESNWENSMNMYRKPLGALKSRQLRSSQHLTEIPGAPNGEYEVMQFKTAFANQSSAVEMVTFSLEKDGQWRSSGYFIK